MTTTIERKEYVPVEGILEDVQRKLIAGPPPEYITLAGSGEPTLHDRLPEVIAGIRRITPTPIAVLTNGSLLWMREVREALREADLVLPSLDAGDATHFQYVNRPHEEITFKKLVDGLVEFSSIFAGSIWLEVFLLGGVTGIASEVRKIAAISRRLPSVRVQLNTVARPPAEVYAVPVPRGELERFASLFNPAAEIIAESCRADLQGNAGVSDEEVLALLSRRPCTCQDVARGLGMHVTEAAKYLGVLHREGKIREVLLNSQWFYTSAKSRPGE